MLFFGWGDLVEVWFMGDEVVVLMKFNVDELFNIGIVVVGNVGSFGFGIRIFGFGKSVFIFGKVLGLFNGGKIGVFVMFIIGIFGIIDFGLFVFKVFGSIFIEISIELGLLLILRFFFSVFFIFFGLVILDEGIIGILLGCLDIVGVVVMLWGLVDVFFRIFRFLIFFGVKVKGLGFWDRN